MTDKNDLIKEAAEVLHQTFHQAWGGPSYNLSLYADSPIWRAQAEALASLVAERTLRDAQEVLAGEDTVEWARHAHTSTVSLSNVIDLLDNLIEELSN